MKAEEPYFTLVLIGLCFALAGDVFLIFTDRSQGYLAGGAVCFLLTHISYAVAFITKTPLSYYNAALFLLLIVLTVVLFSFRIHFSRLNIAIAIYVVVLCAMDACAISMLFSKQVDHIYAVCVALGGTLFAVSDALLAFESFGGSHAKISGMLSTIVYYTSQVLIALSVAL